MKIVTIDHRKYVVVPSELHIETYECIANEESNFSGHKCAFLERDKLKCKLEKRGKICCLTEDIYILKTFFDKNNNPQ